MGTKRDPKSQKYQFPKWCLQEAAVWPRDKGKMVSHCSLPRWHLPGDHMSPGTKRQDGGNPYQEGRSPQSTSRGRRKLAGLCGVCAAAAASAAVRGLCCCCRALQPGCGVGGKGRSVGTGTGWPGPRNSLTFFLAVGRVCKVHFETVSNCKIQCLQVATVANPKLPQKRGSP